MKAIAWSIAFLLICLDAALGGILVAQDIRSRIADHAWAARRTEIIISIAVERELKRVFGPNVAHEERVRWLGQRQRQNP